jgi:hypothetical protein
VLTSFLCFLSFSEFIGQFFFLEREKSLVGRVVIQPRDPTLFKLFQPTVGLRIRFVSVPISRSRSSQPVPTYCPVNTIAFNVMSVHPILILK